MLAIRKFSPAALLVALMAAIQLTAAPIPGVKAGGDDGDKWLVDDAEVVMVFNFKQLLESKLMKDGYSKMLSEKLKEDPKAKDAMEKLGLDPMKDVDSVIFSAVGTSPATAKARLVLKGSFDVEKLSKAMKSSDKVKASKDGAIEVFEVEGQGGMTLYGAFAGKGTFVMTESKDTTVSLAKDGPPKAASLHKDVKAALAKFTGKESMATVIVINDEIKKLSAANKQVEAAMKGLNTITASVTVAEGVTINLVGNTTDAKSTAALEKQLAGLKAIAEIGLGMAESVPPVVKEMVEALKIDKTRDSVIVTLPITKEQIEKAAKMGGGS